MQILDYCFDYSYLLSIVSWIEFCFDANSNITFREFRFIVEANFYCLSLTIIRMNADTTIRIDDNEWWHEWQSNAFW